MSFQSGAVTFQRFRVIGKTSAETMVDKLNKLTDQQFKSSDLGVAEPTEYGWTAGRHIYDTEFSLDNNVFGDSLFFGLRIDTNTVPGSVRKAWLQMETATVARGNPSGFISKAQKVEVKATITKRVDEEQKSGKFRKSKQIPVLWDSARGYLYAAVSNKSYEQLSEIFQTTFGLEIVPVASGYAARLFADRTGKNPELDAAQPTNFCSNPDIMEEPSYPWISKQMDTRNFLGNEFLLWLWFKAEESSETICSAGRLGDVQVFMNKSLLLDCSFGQSGKDTIHDDGCTRSPEAKEALRIGKIPRRAGLSMVIAKSSFYAMFNPETFVFGGTKLPDIEEVDSFHAMFEERISLIADLCEGVDSMFEAFLAERLDNLVWPSVVENVSAWINPKDVPASEVFEPTAA